MIANINPDTGIAYGYISANVLDNEVVDQLLHGAYSTDESREEAYSEWLRDWRRENAPNDDDAQPDEATIQEFWDDYQCDEPDISGEYEGVKYRTSWLGGALNFFILFSPHVTDRARMASPCVPNAAILDTLDGSVTGYNVPDDWRGEV